jgi:hypothetical protein
MADYFGLFYPHEFTPAASLLILLILLGVNCGRRGAVAIIHKREAF